MFQVFIIIIIIIKKRGSKHLSHQIMYFKKYNVCLIVIWDDYIIK